MIPPRVDYTLTPLGQSLGAAFCGVWIWAETHHAEIERARRAFAAVGETSDVSACSETS